MRLGPTGEVSRPAASRLLRARRTFDEKLNALLVKAKEPGGISQLHSPDGEWHHVVACFGIFEYFSQDIEAMCDVFNKVLQAVVPSVKAPSNVAHTLKTSTVWQLHKIRPKSAGPR